VFLAGGSGVLGLALARLLLRKGHEVVATARSREKADRLRALGAEPVFADLLNRDGLEFALRGCRWVFNATSAIPKRVRTRPEDWRLNDRVRTEGTRNLTYAARAVRAERYVHESVALVHGDHGSAWVTEATPCDPGPILRSAMEGEALVQAAHADGLPAVVLRPATFYAGDAWHTRWIADSLRAGAMRLPGDARNFVSSVHVDDVATAFLAAAERGPPGETFLVADDEPLTLREYAGAWASALGARPPRTVPRFLARLAVGRTAVDAIALSQRVLNRKAREALGWSPAHASVREGAVAVARQLAGEDVDDARGA
jgi:nucleoside-diphosphate-sugar epimerase